MSSLLHISSSAIWMAHILVKKLIYQQYSIDLLTLIASVTLSSKYQDSSSSFIDYEIIRQFYHIQNIQQIHVSSSSFYGKILFLLPYRMLKMIFSIFLLMIFLSQHLIISFLIYLIFQIMIFIQKKLFNKLNLYFSPNYFHMK